MQTPRTLSLAILGFAMSTQATPQTTSASKSDWNSLHAEQMKIRQRGTDALQHERTRRKANLCNNKAGAKGGRAVADCLVAEGKDSEQNYLTYVRAIGALLRLPTPDDAAPRTSTRLPFDEAEEVWQKYRDESCKSMATQWADVQSSISYADCRLKLTWNHMNELDSLYSDLWH